MMEFSSSANLELSLKLNHAALPDHCTAWAHSAVGCDGGARSRNSAGKDPAGNGHLLQSHREGIVTSTSLMVDTPWSAEAAFAGRSAVALSVGLHVVLPEGPVPTDSNGVEGPREALERQYARFVALTGGPPGGVSTCLPGCLYW